MKKISGRDIRFFLLGVLAMFLFVLAYDWEDFKQAYKEGYNAAKQKNTEQVEANTTAIEKE